MGADIQTVLNPRNALRRRKTASSPNLPRQEIRVRARSKERHVIHSPLRTFVVDGVAAVRLHQTRRAPLPRNGRSLKFTRPGQRMTPMTVAVTAANNGKKEIQIAPTLRMRTAIGLAARITLL